MAAAVGGAGCGGSGDEASGPPIITGRSLADALALAAKDRFEELGIFGTRVGEGGAHCNGRGTRWRCTLEVVIRDTVRDSRRYDIRLKEADGCWVARQTGTDVGPTGAPSRPQRPDVLRGCLE